VEDDHLVHAVEELGAEDPLELTGDAALHVLVAQAALFGLREPERGVLADLGGADVRGHDDDRVAEVDRAALRVGEAPVLEDLEEDVEHVRVCLLDLVEEDDAVGTTADDLSELAALFVADVARR